MADLTPDQVDILAEAQETIEKLELIARRVEKGKPLGSLFAIRCDRLNYLLGRYQMFLEVQPNPEPRKTAEEITAATEAEWLKRTGEQNTSQQITKAFEGVKDAFKTVSIHSLARSQDSEPEDDRISIDSLANLSASDALKLKPKQHKKWLAIQRQRYRSQDDDS